MEATRGRFVVQQGMRLDFYASDSLSWSDHVTVTQTQLLYAITGWNKQVFEEFAFVDMWYHVTKALRSAPVHNDFMAKKARV
jgi:hypothetical protein